MLLGKQVFGGTSIGKPHLTVTVSLVQCYMSLYNTLQTFGENVVVFVLSSNRNMKMSAQSWSVY